MVKISQINYNNIPRIFKIYLFNFFLLITSSYTALVDTAMPA